MTPLQTAILDALLRHGKSNELDLRHRIGNSPLATGIALRQLQNRKLVQPSGGRDFELSASGVAAITGEPDLLLRPVRPSSHGFSRPAARTLD
jgi:hypothetical protein